MKFTLQFGGHGDKVFTFGYLKAGLSFILSMLLCIVIIFALYGAGFSHAEVDYSNPPEIKAASGMLINASTGQILYEKAPDVPLPPADTTMIMTALLAVENLPLDQVVIMDGEVEAVSGTQIYLWSGEEMTVRDLIFATLLNAADDAALALAKTISGTVPDFANVMNARAQQLGAVSTNFTVPNGVNDPANVTTARDLAIISKEAMTNDTFRQFVSAGEYTIPRTNKNWERRLKNKNSLLFNYPGTNGIKTGTISESKTIACSANRDGRELIAVVLGGTPWGEDVNADAMALLDYGFYGWVDIALFAPDVCRSSIPVSKGQQDAVSLVGQKTVSEFVTIANAGQIAYVYNVPESVEAPVKKGDKIGSVKAMLGEAQLAETELVAEADVAKTLNLFERIGVQTSSVSTALKVTIAVIALIIIIFIIVLLRARSNHINRRTKRMRWGKVYASEVKRVRRIR